jgi:Flp pilus assembly pilin Flp
MSAKTTFLHRSLDTEAASGVEYAVLLSLITVAMLGGLVAVNGAVRGTFAGSASTLRSETSEEPPPPPPPPKVLFATNFDGPPGLEKRAWDMQGKSWQIKHGELQVGFPKGADAEHRTFLKGGGDWKNYTVRLDANLLQGKGYGVFVRASGPPLTGYSFQYDPGFGGGQFLFRKWVNGYEIWPPFAAASPPKGYPWYDRTRRVEVSVHGSTMTATIDGEEVLVGSDDTYDAGTAGIRVWPPGRATFDNFEVTEP